MFEANDTFIEEVVKVKDNPVDNAKRMGLFPVMFLFMVASTIMDGVIKTVLSVCTVISAICAVLMLGYKNIEYEYDYTNGSLEIAKIINNEKRKKIVGIESSEIKLVAAIGTNESLKFDHVKLKTYDCSAHDSEQKDYILVAHSEAKGNDFKVLFTPSDNLLDAMSKYNKRDIYR